ncbi:MAG: helix-turn-helix domain-containing protein [Vampirovibrionales bacterium]|nr:helix-turn-helix domain-containing protein [Vampirovibrionales bacterium]
MSRYPKQGFTKPAEAAPIPTITATSLAQALQEARFTKGLTRQQVATDVMVPLSTMDAIEQGEQLWLGPILRQRLARLFKLAPNDLEALEKKPLELDAIASHGTAMALDMRLWLSQPNPTCPQCGAEITIKRFERQDMQQQRWVALDAGCNDCLFRAQGEWPLTTDF